MEWFENEDFWRDFYPFMFAQEKFDSAPAEVTQILELTNPNGKKVLDLCCGPGRHSLEFARRGFRVTGVDRSPFLLQKAREHTSRGASSVEWVQQDMREFRRPKSFNLACSLFTSFGYFQEEKDEQQVLNNVSVSLARGGVFITELKGKEGLARSWQDASVSDCGDGSCLVQRRALTDDCSRVRSEWLLVKNGKVITHKFDHFIYSGRELKDLLLRAGFSDVRLFGDLQGSPYGITSPRLIAVARKHA
jgi:SAM-dependent methyltransferase